MTNINLQDIQFNVFSYNVNNSNDGNNINNIVKQTNSVKIKNKGSSRFLSKFKTILNLAIYPKIQLFSPLKLNKFLIYESKHLLKYQY